MIAVRWALAALGVVCCVLGCDAKSAENVRDLGRTRFAVGGCEVLTSEGSLVQLDLGEIQAIRELPHYSSASLSVPGEDLQGSVILSVESDDRRVLYIGGSDDEMSHTLSATVDVTSALEIGPSREMRATLEGVGEVPVGQVALSGFEGALVQGAIDSAVLNVEPTGFFRLELGVGELLRFPPSEEEVSDLEQEAIARFSGGTVVVLGRLIGSCMAEGVSGPVRVMDVLGEDRCADVIGHL